MLYLNESYNRFLPPLLAVIGKVRVPKAEHIEA